MQLITVRGSVQLSFDTFGRQRFPLVLLISGAGAPAAFWPDTFCEDLAAAGRFVVRYCHRDTGDSTHFDEPYAIDELLQDMTALLHQFERNTYHLAGHSMGGYLAQMAMCRFPDKLKSVTSISAGPSVSPEMKSKLNMSTAGDKTWEVLMRNQPTGNFDADLPAWLETWRFLNAQRPFDADMATRYTRHLYDGHPRNARVAVNHVQAMTTVPDSLVNELPQVRCPFLVIHGTDDPLVPLDNGEASARLVPKSDIVRLQGAGHMFFDWNTWQEIGKHLTSHTSA